jgi:hypothetical protein
MVETTDRSKIDVWEANEAGVEGLAESIEGDGLPYSMALAELLRSLHRISQTLSGKRASDDPPG